MSDIPTIGFLYICISNYQQKIKVSSEVAFSLHQSEILSFCKELDTYDVYTH